LTLDDVVVCLFAFSLFPYLVLGFLYHLGKEENKTPELVLFGFKFLLVFVGTSIPEAISVKMFYCAQVCTNFLFFFHTNRAELLQLQEFSQRKPTSAARRSPHTSI
jgi:hypothetical protein